MVITAKVNMVLHGDGSAHIFKDDAFRPFSKYHDLRLRPCSDAQRSISKAEYPYEVCELFDVVVSNPPFGITLPSDTRTKLPTALALPETTPSEGLFLERCFQLLKPEGRLGLSFCKITLECKGNDKRPLVSIPYVSCARDCFHASEHLHRHANIDQLGIRSKKSGKDIAAWDATWQKVSASTEDRIKLAAKALSKQNLAKKTASEISDEFLAGLNPIMTTSDLV